MTKKERRKRAALRAIKRAVEHCGGVNGGLTALALRLRVTTQRINNWRVRGGIPMEYVEKIADISGLMPNQVDPYVPVVVFQEEEFECATTRKRKFRRTPTITADGLPDYLKGGDE